MCGYWACLLVKDAFLILNLTQNPHHLKQISLELFWLSKRAEGTFLLAWPHLLYLLFVAPRKPRASWDNIWWLWLSLPALATRNSAHFQIMQRTMTYETHSWLYLTFLTILPLSYVIHYLLFYIYIFCNASEIISNTSIGKSDGCLDKSLQK